MKKNSIATRLAFDAMFVAIYFVLSSFVSIKTGIIEFSFSTIPIFLCAFLCGFPDAVAVSVCGAFLEQLIYGLAPNTVLWMLPVVILGVYTGLLVLLYRRKPLSVVFMIVAIVCGELLFTAVNTAALYIDSMIYEYPVKALVLLVPPRLANCGVRCVCSVAVVPALYTALKRFFKKR